MIPLLRGCCVLSGLALLLAARTVAQGPGSNPASKPLAGPKEPTPVAPADPPVKRLDLDKLKLPPNAVIVICEEGKNPPRLLPNMIVMTPEQYKELKDRIALLEKQLKPEKVTPNVCRLTGRIEGDVAFITAELDFQTEQPRSLVVLGFQGGFLTNLDGELPLLAYGDDGYSVLALKPGQHELTLRLKVPVTVKRADSLAGGTDHSFELGLPGAPATSLTLVDLPRTVKEVRCNGKEVPVPGGKVVDPVGLADPAGIVKRLMLSWREPPPLPEGAGLPAARWQATVQFHESYVLTTAKGILSDPRGRTREWRIYTPPDSDLKVLAADAAAYQVVASENNSTFIIKAPPGPPAEQVEVQVETRQARPVLRLPVGPFFLVGSNRQEGMIDVRAAPEALTGFRLIYHRQGDVRQQDVPGEQGSGGFEARFQYRDLPEAGKGSQPLRATRKPPLEIELKTVPAYVETSVDHDLVLRPAEQGWQVKVITHIHARPQHNGTHFLDVLLPQAPLAATAVAAVVASAGQPLFPPKLFDPALHFQLGESSPVRPPTASEYGNNIFREKGDAFNPMLKFVPGQRKARILLDRAQKQPFTIKLEGTYILSGNLTRARLELPRPVTRLDKGGKVVVEADDQLELLPPGEGPEAIQGRQRITTTWDRAPTQIDLSWRAYKPEPAAMLADVDLQGTRARVRQELKLSSVGPARPGRADGATERLVTLRVDGRVTGLRVVQGGRQPAYDPAAGIARVEIAPSKALVLEYEFSVPPAAPGGAHGEPAAKGRPPARLFQVPLFRPEGDTILDARVRVWCEPGTLPALPDSELPDEVWKDQGAEVVDGHDSLPALVLQGDGRKPLSLRFLDSSLPPPPSVLVDRGLIEVLVDDQGAKHFRTRYLLTKLNTAELDIELPAALAQVGELQILLDDRKVPWTEALAGGRLVRVKINPSLYQKRQVTLLISFDLPGGVPEQDGICQRTLVPPTLHGAKFQGLVRWAVTLPPGRVALPPEGNRGDTVRWVLHGWLLCTEPTDSYRSLETWLTGKDAGGQDSAADDVPGLVFSANPQEAVTVLHFPLLGWLLLCSGVLLALALALLVAPLSRTLFWIVLGLVILGVCAAGWTWPALFPIVLYGCEPAVPVLIAIVTAQWLLQRHYQRRVVFMPGFTRLKPGSSVSRGSSVDPRPREKSTVDAPAPLSSVNKAPAAAQDGGS